MESGLGWKNLSLSYFILSLLVLVAAAKYSFERLERAAENVSTTWSDGPSSTYLLLVLL